MDNDSLGGNRLNDNEPKERTNIKTGKMNKSLISFLVLIVILLAVPLAYLASIKFNFFNTANIIKDNSENAGTINNNEVRDGAETGPLREVFNFKLNKTAFAKNVSGIKEVTPASNSPLPNLEEIDNLDDFREAGFELSEGQKNALETDGFFLAENTIIGSQEGGVDDFADMYVEFGGSSNKFMRQGHEALYISSDVALHLYHILIDRSFQKIEEQKFQPMIKEMSRVLFLDSIGRYNSAATKEEKNTYQRLSIFYLVPLAVLEAAREVDIKLEPSDFKTFAEYMEAEESARKKASQDNMDFLLDGKNYQGIELPDEIFNIANSELELIADAKGVFDSPLFTPYRNYFKNDYTQFKPRSHYTKNNILKSYFIAMMWYGRMGFSLDSPELTRDAIAITGQVNTLAVDKEDLAGIYNTLSSAIEFFVGEVDDLTPYDYTVMIKKTYGDTLDNEEFNNSEKLEQFIQASINELPLPRIVSEAVGLYDDGGERDKLLKQLMQFRFFGQRFTPDAYVLNNLTQGVGAPDPDTGQKLPSMTTALMPLYVIEGNNELIGAYIDKWALENAPDSDLIINKKLNELIGEFSGYSEGIWTQNIYWSWLNTYRSLLGDYQDGYPYFMTTDNWRKKNLGTVLGSYTELKHDTLLYAKQSYAELGGGGDNPDEPPPVPLGYVEADYVFWQRLADLSKKTADGLNSRGLMPLYFDYRYNKFGEYLDFFKDIAKKELENEEISEEEFEKIRTSGRVFKDIASALPGEVLAVKDQRAGIIADIHTDAVDEKILYEATGKPYVIYVAVKDGHGVRLTRGAAFNHYELSGPLAERYSDEDWQAIVYEGKGELPDADEWSQDLLR